MKRENIVFSFIIIVAIFSFAAGAKDVRAVPITGSLHFNGGATPDAAATSWADAVGVVFTGTSAVNVNPAPTGFYTGLGGESVSFTGFTFSPSAPVAALWSIDLGSGNFASFDLATVVVAFQGPVGPGSFLSLSGTGMLKTTLAGFDDTPGSWVFSGNSSNNSTFSFSADSSAVVPEPGTIALLGIGLAGLGGRYFRKRIKRRK